MDATRTYPGPQPNPGTRPETPSNIASSNRKRIPMSVARQRLQLEVNAVPGHVLHWALESNLHQFLEAGYELVGRHEVVVNARNVGYDPAASGNQDLGSNVRVLAGVGESGSPEYHILVKIKEEFYREDQKLIAERNSSVLSAVFRGEKIISSDSEDNSQRYVDKERTKVSGPLFQRYRPKIT